MAWRKSLGDGWTGRTAWSLPQRQERATAAHGRVVWGVFFVLIKNAVIEKKSMKTNELKSLSKNVDKNVLKNMTQSVSIKNFPIVLLPHKTYRVAKWNGFTHITPHTLTNRRHGNTQRTIRSRKL
ncbi:MAG: hypothetical protein ACKVUS_08375 [Saprospiraceae bacterium]